MDAEIETEAPFLSLGTEEDVRQALNRFLTSNPEAVLETEAGESKSLVIRKPWGDPTLVAYVPEDGRQEFLDCLNAIRMPSRLSALWHQDTMDLEVIWTAYRLSAAQAEIAGRSFVFHDEGRSFECEFGGSSERLLILAANTFPASTPSETLFRNMTSFHGYSRTQSDDRGGVSLDKPRSFWIRALSLAEPEMLKLVNRVNFFLTYFDSLSPHVIVHNSETTSSNAVSRYVRGDFPQEIVSGTIDENILSFWLEARKESTFLQFILYYRIVEYAAHHRLDLKLRHQLRKILADPASRHQIDRVVDRLAEGFDPNRADDVARFRQTLEDLADPALIWREIERNKDAFNTETEFDGGFVLPPLCSASETAATFCTGGITKIAVKLRSIRNVLAHGRDQSTGKVMIPSQRNLNLLIPWVNVLSVAAGEVAAFEANT